MAARPIKNIIEPINAPFEEIVAKLVGGEPQVLPMELKSKKSSKIMKKKNPSMSKKK